MSRHIKNYSENIPLRIKSVRKRQKLTQSQLASALHKSESAVRMWELGKSEPDSESITAMSKIFNIPTDYLLGLPYIVTRPQEDWHSNEIEEYDRSDKATKEYLLYKWGNGYFESHGNGFTPVSTKFTVPQTEQENNMLLSYRAHPEMQAAVDRILGLDEDNDVIVYAAANSADNHAPEMVRKTHEKWQRIENAPDTDDELI